VIRRRAFAFLVAGVSMLFAAAPAPAPTTKPDLPSCALGRVPTELRTVLPRAVAREQRRFAASLRGVSPAARERASRTFATGAAAYLYGLPTVVLRITVQRYPVNELLSVAELATPRLRSVVAPNHDTLYTVSQLDLSGGPLVIDAPATGGRYSILQLLDAYTNVVDYVGSGSERDSPATVALVPPGWQGTPPAGVRVVRSPTKLIWLLGRTLIDGPADLAGATQVLGAYNLTPLDDWLSGVRKPGRVLEAFPNRQNDTEVPGGLGFYDALGEALAADPPPARDTCALRSFARAGIGAGRTPSSAAKALDARALRAAVRAGIRVLEETLVASRRASRRTNNGWSISAADTGRFGTDYAHRAQVAAVGLASNTRSEAIYPTTDTDRDGRRLTGKHDYVVSFPAGGLPPVRAFWSLTLYGGDLFLVPNQIDRYSVGDRTEGLRYGRGRSLEIYVQHDPPPAPRRAHWLPAPAGRFSLYLRLYEPKRAAVRGDWSPPTVTRITSAR
jgi:hypothetical protein